ncbi:hypothetical protein ACQ4PT_046776 [Festuca glaucescens]
MDSTMWPELPPDVLREVSRHLGDARDFVHFHAVCKPWRDSHEAARTTRKQWVLPWLLAPDNNKTPLRLRCVFSRTTYGARPPFSEGRLRNWVASADGTAVWYLAERPSLSLRDPLTGAVTLLLPPFPQDNGRWESSPRGVVYSDGTVLFRCLSVHDDTTKFKVALLRPGDLAWMVVERTFKSVDLYDLYICYYQGKIIITVDGPVMTPDDEAGVGDVLVVPRPCELDDYYHERSYVLESRGELLCVSIYTNQDYPEAFGGAASVPGLVRALYVSVHTLQEEGSSVPGKMRWVRKHGDLLADRMLFLGWPSSFAVDASRLSGHAVSGGCAYFVYWDDGVVPNRPCCVFRYNLIDNMAKFVDRLPEGWNRSLNTWLFHQPSIAPSEDIGKKFTEMNLDDPIELYLDDPIEVRRCFVVRMKIGEGLAKKEIMTSVCADALQDQRWGRHLHA